MTFDRKGFRHEVGKRIAYYRRSGRRRFNQQWLADALGICRATIANIESGRQSVSIDRLWQIAVILKIPIKKLIPERTAANTEEPA